MKSTSLLLPLFVLMTNFGMEVFGFLRKRPAQGFVADSRYSPIVKRSLMNNIMQSDEYSDLRNKVSELLIKKSQVVDLKRSLYEDIMESGKYPNLKKKVEELIQSNPNAVRTKRSLKRDSMSSNTFSELRKRVQEGMLDADYGEKRNEKRNANGIIEDDLETEEAAAQIGLIKQVNDLFTGGSKDNSVLEKTILNFMIFDNSDKYDDLRKKINDYLKLKDEIEIEKMRLMHEIMTSDRYIRLRMEVRQILQNNRVQMPEVQEVPKLSKRVCEQYIHG